MKSGPKQQSAGSADKAMQGAEAHPMIAGAKAEVWTGRMLSALVNGVQGGKWFSLMDRCRRRLRLEVFAPKTLAVAWAKVRDNKGVAGVDGQSIERFAARQELYLAELSARLRNGIYVPQAVKRMDIPKGDGRTRPLGIPTVKDRIVQQAVRLVIEPTSSMGSRREVSASVRDGDAMMRRAEGARFQRDARGRWSDQGGVHACGGRRLAGLF